MTKDDVIELIKQHLGFYSNFDSITLLRNMDLVQSLYEGGDATVPLPWFLFDATAILTTTPGDRVVALPENFICFDEEWPLKAVSAQGQERELCREREISLLELSLASGEPTHYSFDGTRLYVAPIPDASYIIKAPYYARGTALSSAVTSPWFANFPRLIAEETAYYVSLGNRDRELRSTLNDLRTLTKFGYLARVEQMRPSLMLYASNRVG